MIGSKFNDAESILGIQPFHHIAFTDGSCYPNNKSKNSRGGYASVFVSGPFNDKCLYGNLDISNYNASNIRAEGIAIFKTLELIKEFNDKKETNKKSYKVTIVTDCMFWINMLETYMPKWKKDKFKEKANPDLTQNLWILYNDVKKNNEIKLIHMKSHNKDKWESCEEGSYNKFCFDQNDFADKLCSYARKKLTPKQFKFEDINFE
jgi:ribonuclease HI